MSFVAALGGSCAVVVTKTPQAVALHNKAATYKAHAACTERHNLCCRSSQSLRHHKFAGAGHWVVPAAHYGAGTFQAAGHKAGQSVSQVCIKAMGEARAARGGV